MFHKKMKLRKQLAIADGFLIILATFVLMNVLVGGKIFPTKLLSSYLPGGATTVNQLLIQQILQVLILLSLTLLFLYPLRGGNLQQIGLRPFKNWRWFGYAVFWGIVTFFVMLFVSALMVSLFPKWAEPQSVTNIILQAQTIWEWVAVLLVVCVLAPFSEEILFRGYVYHSLRNYCSTGTSILVASLLFGCMHYDLFRLLPLTLVGICLNLVAVRADSLWGSIIMHATWNCMMTIMMMLA